MWLKVDGLESNALTGFNGFLIVDHYALFFKFLILGADGPGDSGVPQCACNHPRPEGRVLRTANDGLWRPDAAGGFHRTDIHLHLAGT